MHKNDEYKEKLKDESLAFDKQIIERVNHGHVPDLRGQRCEWFYNNVWRDPFYTNLFYGTTVRHVVESINKYIDKKPNEVNVLEIACGPGHISLEISRNGFNVTGFDLSPVCIKAAQQTASNDPYIKERGSLEYKAGNIFDYDASAAFDVVVFSCALHHFGDVDNILKKVDSLLKPSGIIFVSEPKREILSTTDALVIHLIRTLLSGTGHYFKEFEIPRKQEDISECLEEIKNEFDYKNENGENIQSPMDNEANYSDMFSALNQNFVTLENKDDFSFFDRIIGGIRFESIEKEHEVAQWLYLVDKMLCGNGGTSAKHFHYIGKKRDSR